MNIPKRNRSITDLTGKQFGRLTAVSFAGSVSGNARWLCRCVCGNTREVAACHLKSGHTSSCGCAKSETTAARNRTHGKTGTPAHAVWVSMLARCANASDPIYGGRGIRVCERWKDLENFIADMGVPPDGMTIDRIDSDGDYCPDNCRWATMLTQARNKRSNRLVEHNGETLCVSEWAERTGIGAATIGYRLRRGWSVADALTIKPTLGHNQSLRHTST